MAKRRFLPEDLYVIPFPSDPQLAPDGSRVVYVRTVADRATDRDRSDLWELALDEATPRRLTYGGTASSPRWSPDGRWLAFLASEDGADGPPQLWVLPATGGAPQRLTDLDRGAGVPVWSPDGAKLAYAAPVAGPDAPAEDDPHAPIVYRRMDEKADGVGLRRGGRVHLHVTKLNGVGGGDTRRLTFGDFDASTPVWSPDGAVLAFSAAMDPDRDLAPASPVYEMSAEGGAPWRVTATDSMLAPVAYRPDGGALLVVGMERLAVGHQRLFSADRKTTELVALTLAYDRNVMIGAVGYPGAAPRYTADGERVLFCARDRGRVHLLDVDAQGGEPRVVLGGDRVIAGLSHTDRHVAVVAATADSPGELVLADLDGGNERQLTHLFAEALPDVELVPPRSRTFTAPDGTELEGFVLRADDATGPTPLLLDVHGGPHNAWSPAFDGGHAYHQLLVDAGWTVLCVNPRGSDGYGEAFWQGVAGGWGRDDEADLLAAVDALVADGTADPERLAITGYSYGGFMSCWLSARTDRFKAVVPGGSLSDQVSMLGTSEASFLIGLEISPERETLAELSPLRYVDGVRAPTLLLHGENDLVCPIGQAEQWFEALRTRRVPVELVRYPDASHPFIFTGRPSHRIDYSRRVHDWVRTHVDTPATVARKWTAGQQAYWQGRLDELARRHKVVGASLAVLADGDVLEAATGVLNVETGEKATPDSVFQIGSITKVYTTSLVMQLVDEGKVELDQPLADLLDEFTLAESAGDARKQITVRHLLTHTSGIEGDHFVDTGRGDDCVEKYVQTVAKLGLIHPVGATMSYCNTGFCLVGRLVEKLTGLPWHAALKQRLLDPAGLGHTVALPEDAIRYRAAYGHEVPEDAPPKLVATWLLPYSGAPAGATLCATARDVVGFAEVHLGGGRAPDGTGVLSETSVTAMQRREVALPDPWTLGSHWGLGWILFDWDERGVYGHDGGTFGQSSYLRVVPDAGVAVALLTNGGHTQDLYQDLFRELLAELCDLHMPATLTPPAEPATYDAARYVGTYERVGIRVEVAEKESKLIATVTLTGELAELINEPPEELALVPVEEDLFVTRSEGSQTWIAAVFYALPDGARYLHFGGRATPKVT
jgi:dipeptidyl aminopeptidase/acylaminoacyl peptidase/CubicO group peptidase (beta-lactamase class C family)